MRLLCTAPCQPHCTNEAAHTLVNAKSRAFLGMNCLEHLGRLNKDDYDRVELPAIAPATYPKLSSDEYAWSFMVRGGVHMYLTQTSTGKVKAFYQAGHDISSLTALENHMNSLTDDLCSQWFNERVKKGKQAKEKENG